nr:SAP domain-containing protein [Photorhabdus heterorhabditis]
MSQEAFENGYFYVAELRQFAKSLGITSSNLKKNELELYIRSRLFGYSGDLPIAIPNKRDRAGRDLLTLKSLVINYVSDKQTKNFLLEQVNHQYGPLPDKSGQWYWLNHWRKVQIVNNNKITYGDLVEHLASLKQQEGRLPQIPSARLNNFISDFIADPENKGKGKQQALEIWQELKEKNLPKTYLAYKQNKNHTR